MTRRLEPIVELVTFLTRYGVTLQIRHGYRIVWERHLDYFDIGSPDAIFSDGTLKGHLDHQFRMAEQYVRENLEFIVAGKMPPHDKIPLAVAQHPQPEWYPEFHEMKPKATAEPKRQPGKKDPPPHDLYNDDTRPQKRPLQRKSET